MLVAVLNGTNIITLIEDISEKGMTAGYRPAGTWVEAQSDWESGGTVVSGNYTPPPPVNYTPIDTAVLNDALAAQGSVVRAIAEVMFKEINKLRVKGGDAAYTKAQFVAALKAEMRG